MSEELKNEIMFNESFKKDLDKLNHFVEIGFFGTEFVEVVDAINKNTEAFLMLRGKK